MSDSLDTFASIVNTACESDLDGEVESSSLSSLSKFRSWWIASACNHCFSQQEVKTNPRCWTWPLQRKEFQASVEMVRPTKSTLCLLFSRRSMSLMLLMFAVVAVVVDAVDAVDQALVEMVRATRSTLCPLLSHKFEQESSVVHDLGEEDCALFSHIVVVSMISLEIISLINGWVVVVICIWWFW